VKEVDDLDIYSLAGEHFRKMKPDKKVNKKSEKKIEGIIRLSSNENCLGISTLVKEAIENEIANQNYYPDSRCDRLRESIGENLNVAPEKIVVGNGSDELISIIANIFIKPNLNGVCQEKSFPRYYHAINVNGGKCIKVPLSNFNYNLKEVLKHIDKDTRVVYLSNPNNPTGTTFNQKDAEFYLENVPEHLITVFDEAYYDFVSNKDFPDMIKLMEKYPNKNILILRTFSKIFGMAGLRVGYGISNNDDLIDMINLMLGTFNVNGLAQAGALAALKDEKFAKSVLEHCLEEKDEFYKFFDGSNIEYIRSETNFILIKTKIDGEILTDRLKKKGIMVRCMKQWEFPTEYIRITIGTSEENVILRENLKELLK
jgi:histidinol-phosphate aminotransferase